MPVDVKGEVMTYEEERIDGYLYVFLIGKVREKGILWFSYKDISKELWMFGSASNRNALQLLFESYFKPYYFCSLFHTHPH